MKKYILSFLLIGVFSSYAVFSRVGSSGNLSVGSIGSGRHEDTSPDPSPVTILPPPTPTPLPSPVPDPIPIPTPSPAPIPEPAPAPVPAPTPIPQGQYKNGTYVGPSVNAYYGYIQVEAIIKNGKLADVVFLDYPQDRNTSLYINGQAMPYLKQEAIQAQSANVGIISGATDSSGAFRQSLAYALNQARN